MGRTKTKRATVKSQTLIINRETGKTLRKLTPASWQEIVAVNLDFNEHVIQTKKDILEFIKNIRYIKENTNCSVGCNLLLNEKMFQKDNIMNLKDLTEAIFQWGVDGIYLQSDTHIKLDKHKLLFSYLLKKHKNLFIDNKIKGILKTK